MARCLFLPVLTTVVSCPQLSGTGGFSEGEVSTLYMEKSTLLTSTGYFLNKLLIQRHHEDVRREREIHHSISKSPRYVSSGQWNVFPNHYRTFLSLISRWWLASCLPMPSWCLHQQPAAPTDAYVTEKVSSPQSLPSASSPGPTIFAWRAQSLFLPLWFRWVPDFKCSCAFTTLEGPPASWSRPAYHSVILLPNHSWIQTLFTFIFGLINRNLLSQSFGG